MLSGTKLLKKSFTSLLRNGTLAKKSSSNLFQNGTLTKKRSTETDLLIKVLLCVSSRSLDFGVICVVHIHMYNS